MDAYNLLALAISLAALVISVVTSRRQIHLASGGNHLPVVLDAFKESRQPEWLAAEEYILDKLAEEHPPDRGWRGLPPEARTHAAIIGVFYDDLGKLVAHGMIDERLIIGSYGTTIVHLWDALAPFVYAERHAQGNHFWTYFEDLAARTAATPPGAVYATLHLRTRRPRNVMYLKMPAHRPAMRHRTL